MPIACTFPPTELLFSGAHESSVSSCRSTSIYPCSSTAKHGVNVSSIERLAGEDLQYSRAGHWRGYRSKKSSHTLICCGSSDCFGSGDVFGVSHVRNLMHGLGHRPKKFRCPSLSADTGYSEMQRYLPILEDSYEKSVRPRSGTTNYTPHPEALDPFSQLIYERAMGRNLHWWRFLSYCRSQLDSNVLIRRKYTLIGKSYTKVRLPRISVDALAVPAINLAPKQDAFDLLLYNISTALNEFSDCLARMGDRYGSSLLCLLVMGYCLQGFRCFPWLAMSFYLKDGLTLDPTTLQFLQSTVNLPLVAKPVYGIISDAIYIGGERRLPYLRFACALQTLSWSVLVLHSGVRSSVGPLMGVLLVSNMGAAIADVINDALVAESVQKERGKTKGELQSFVWLALAVGGVIGNFVGGLALSWMSSTTMFAIFAVFAAGHLLFSSFVKERSFNFKSLSRQRKKNIDLMEKSSSAIDVLKVQAARLIDLVTLPDIAMPLAWFAASYAVIPAMGGSIFYYQAQYLHIHPTYLGLAKVMGQMGLMAGSVLYNRYLKGSSPRKVLLAVQVLLSACMLSDIILVSRMNIRLGIPDHLFVLGASAFAEAIAQFKVLPFSVLLTQLCPSGSEGSLLAFFMSCHCLATILSGYSGTYVASMLHISVDNFTGLPMGIFIQSIAALIPLFWISCIPATTHKLAAV